MKEVKDFFNSALERVSNQFMISFLISWIVLNWKFVIAFFKYKAIDYDVTHDNGYIDYLDTLLTPILCSILLPIGLASLYVWKIKPLIDVCIHKIEIDKNLKINILKKEADPKSFFPYLLHLEEMQKKQDEVDRFKNAFDKYKESISKITDLESEIISLKESKLEVETHFNEAILDLKTLNYENKIIEQQYKGFIDHMKYPLTLAQIEASDYNMLKQAKKLLNQLEHNEVIQNSRDTILQIMDKYSETGPQTKTSPETDVPE